ncbi:MAG: two-component system sensor histidine kinase AtoS [Bacillota bacterium]
MKRSFTNRLLILVFLLLTIPLLLTVYMLQIIKNSEISLLEEQKSRLSHVAYLFEQQIPFSLRDYIVDSNLSRADRSARAAAIGNVVNKVINDLRQQYPDVHLGFYCRDVDIFYDGTNRQWENYSLRRKKAFDEVIQRSQPLEVNVGEQEGGIVEIYRPFIKKGQIEGVIRSAEYLSETGFYGKRRSVERIVYTLVIIIVLLGVGGALVIFRQLVTQVEHIKEGVRQLSRDLHQKIPALPGELGEIVSAVNGFARRIAELNLYNETMLAAIDDGIVVVNNAGQVMIANKAASTMFALPEETAGVNYKDLLPPDSPFSSLIERTLAEGRSRQDVQVDWRDQQHGTRHFLVSTAVLVEPQGHSIGAVLSCREVTEYRRLQENVQRQERLAALGKLVAGVAHEIRNPLTSINCYIQHWQDHHQPSPRALATVQREINRLDNIVDQLLYFTKPAEAQFVSYDLNALVQNVLAFFQEVYHGKFNLVTRLASQLPVVWLDPEQIERVLGNIIFNALQAIAEGGNITVTTGRAGEQMVFVSIADDGCGIAREHLPRLFDPFYTTRPKGTGLGLAIAHEIVKAHGGRIEVQSEPGEGTCFTIYLPVRGDDAS